jgi:hypothetical protein
MKTRYITVPNWNKHHEYPSVGGLRNLIFNKDKNGFHKVIKKIGKRVLIDEAAFFEWVANEGNSAK